VWHWSCAVQVTAFPEQLPDWQASATVQALPSLQAVPFALVGFEQAPVDVLQLPAVWHWSWAVQVTGFDPVQLPDWQVSVCVQAFPSLQAVPFALAGFEQTPVDVLQVPAVWHWSCAVQVTAFPVQVPDWQASAVVQALPSSQVVPFALFGFEQTPVDVLHVPAVWHWSCAVQVIGFEPAQVPDWQLSVCVQAFPSLHDVPFAFWGFEQTPLAGSHIPALWHWSDAVQLIGLLPTQAPEWQLSVCVQALPSLQAVPSGFPVQALQIMVMWAVVQPGTTHDAGSPLTKVSAPQLAVKRHPSAGSVKDACPCESVVCVCDCPQVEACATTCWFAIGLPEPSTTVTTTGAEREIDAVLHPGTTQWPLGPLSK
jgi:hypothetical protein